jgi:GYF domain 2
MSTPDSGAQWYVARDGRQHGPISDVEMRKLVELGHLRPADLIWRPGFADWRPAQAVFAAAPPAPTPSPKPSPDFHPRPQSTMPRFESTAGHGAAPGAAHPYGAQSPSTNAAQSSNLTQGQNASQSPMFVPQSQPVTQPQPVAQNAMQIAPAPSAPRELSQGSFAAPAPQPQNVQFQPAFTVQPQFQPQSQPQAQPQFQPTAQPAFEPRFEAAPRPQSDVYDNFEDTAPKSSVGRRLAIAASLALLIGGGGYLIKNSDAGRSVVTGLKDKAVSFAKAGLGGSGAQTATSEPDATAATSQDAPPAAAETNTATTEAAVAPTPDSASMPDGAKALELKLQQFAHWQLIATEFPDWYRERLMAGAKLMAENKPETDVTQYLAKSLVELRRSNAEAALAASPATLKKMAGNFQGLVTRMGQESAPICMTFISSGEANPTVVDIANNPAKNAEINAHFTSIFTAISEGRKTPTQHAAPADGDYKLLVAQLVKIGWTQAELELFADPKGSTRTTPERYCKMMQDFFQAHLSLPDAAVQERLLHRTLKLVVAG